jgi:hypothetical protein
VMIVPLPGEEAQIVTQQVAHEPEHAPTRARGRPIPVRDSEVGEHFEQSRALEPEQRSERSRRFRPIHHLRRQDHAAQRPGSGRGPVAGVVLDEEGELADLATDR